MSFPSKLFKMLSDLLCLAAIRFYKIFLYFSANFPKPRPSPAQLRPLAHYKLGDLGLVPPSKPGQGITQSADPIRRRIKEKSRVWIYMVFYIHNVYKHTEAQISKDLSIF